MTGMVELFKQRLQSELYARYRIDSQVEILALLRALRDARSQIVLHFGAQSYIVSRLLELWPDKRRAALDFGPDEAANAALLRAGRAVVETQLHQISIQYEVDGFRRIELPDGPAIEAAFPSCVLRLQRREAFRVPTRITQPLHLHVPAQDNCPEEVKLRLVDISAGGIGVLVEEGSSFAPQTGMVLRGCRLDLPQVGLVVADVEVRHVIQRDSEPKPQLQCGMRFLALPPQMSNFVQRFVMQREREWRKLR